MHKVAKIKQQWDKNKEDEKKHSKHIESFSNLSKRERERKRGIFLPAKFYEKFSQCLRNVWVPSSIEKCDVCSVK